MHIKHTILIYSCLPEDEPKSFETRRRQQKLKIKLYVRVTVHLWLVNKCETN